jgi:outer membrane immunogenic protein
MAVSRILITGALSLATGFAAVGPAAAYDFSFLYPATDAQLGSISKTGFIISPDIDYNRFNFSGSGSKPLKDGKGFRAGLELGYDYQMGGLVFGVLGMVSYADIDGKETGGSAAQLRTNMNYLGTLSGRVGYVFDRWMVYGTAGVAFAGLEVENRTLKLKSSQDLTGWVAGGGVEYVYNKWITVRAEYTRIDLSEESFASLTKGKDEVGGTLDLIRIGVIQRF